MVSFPLIRIQSSVTYPDMLPPHKVRLNKKSTTLRLTMIFKQPLNSPCKGRKKFWFWKTFLASFLSQSIYGLYAMVLKSVR